MSAKPDQIMGAVERLTAHAEFISNPAGRWALVQTPRTGIAADLKAVLSALQEAREAEGHYVCGFQQANMEARMILGDTAENAAIQAELVATADRRALSPGGADE